MEWIVVGGLYVWAGVTFCCSTYDDMHPKQRQFELPIIMLFWPAYPFYYAYQKFTGSIN